MSLERQEEEDEENEDIHLRMFGVRIVCFHVHFTAVVVWCLEAAAK